MRKPHTAITGSLLLLSVAAAGAAPAPTVAAYRCAAVEADADADRGFTLRVRVSNLDSNQGNVAVALFDSPDAFPDQKRALRGKVTSIDRRRASVVFSGLKPGSYAVAVLHDENANGEMDFNFLGIPLEGYGFSNDASATFGPPSFSAAAFRLKPRASAIAIKARYFSL